MVLARFPAKEERRKLWIAAVRRWKWSPTKYSYICSQHFLPSDYKVPPGEPYPRLKPTAIPSVFPEFPKYLQRAPPKNRRELKRKTPKSPEGIKAKKQRVEKSAYIATGAGANSPTKKKLKGKIKTLNQKLRRRNNKINSLHDIIDTMKNRSMLSFSAADLLKDQFSGISSEILMNEIRNLSATPKWMRYSEELKKFALTVNFYSHKAYSFLRKIYKLPHPSSIKQWTASVNCEPGFLSEVFRDLEKQSESKPDMVDCALLIDAMAIRKQVIYDQARSKYSGFVDYGNLIPENTEWSASEALDFMLTGLKNHWKCPVGYFLIDKCNAETQVSLNKTCLSLAADHGLRIWSITCDGTYTNFASLKGLGCKFSTKYDEMVVRFKHPTRDYFVYITHRMHVT